MQTVFGFFPKSAFENQTGLPVADAIKERCALPATQVIELTTRPARYFERAPRVAAGMLCMLDRITAHDPGGGAQGLGYMRAEKLVDPREWFFKAHFFQDPVQPGSLGIEALCQLLQLCMVEQGLHAGLSDPRFEPVALRESFTWKYRGQVVPSNERITTEIELTQIVREDNGVCAFADAWLWVDGKPIYQAKRLGMRVVGGPAPRDDERRPAKPAQPDAARSGSAPNPTAKRALVDAIRDHWRGHFGLGAWPVEDLYLALVSAFIRDVHVADAQALAAMPQGSALFVANHQVGVESLMFSLLAPLWTGTLTSTLAKAEHQQSWLGKLCQLAFSYPGARDPQLLVFFEREDRAALPGVLAQLALDMRGGRSAMIHVEGTRALQCRAPVQKLSAAVIELAIEADRPVVPVRFAGALPVMPASQRLEFPYGCAAQSIWVGSPIDPGALRALGLKQRKERVLQAMNELGPALLHETPNPPNPALAQAAREWQAATGASPEHAMLMAALRCYPVESPLSSQLLEAADAGRLSLGDSPAERWLSELAKRLYGPKGPVIVPR
jgi:3-hydroxymyristoyl/3-hydroxydecanoyl-(acyl carrier protein) dehydratase/1-acyl-sn-glycerol-3-phosphate acyltransferase